MTAAILMLAMFHSHRQSKKAVLKFTRDAIETLASYQDGSLQAWLEAPEIEQISEHIEVLVKNPRLKDAEQREREIEDELGDLHDRDLELQKMMMESEGEVI